MSNTNTEQNASLHRFNNKVALCFHSTHQLYLTPEMALKLAKELETFAKDVQTVKFTNSQLNTVEITE